ncbi:MAG TPA: iron ABC transporter permease [Thermomicrobiales bacterium]|nr:iron ABC transporter permease [Thermomicrobiales bacterium]
MATTQLPLRPGPNARPINKPGHVTIRTRFFSVRLNTRVLGMSLVAGIAMVLLAVWAMTLGSLHIPFADVVGATFGRGDEDARFVVRELRFPRVLSAILIGAALAMSGAIFQGIVRNALVSPDIIGINAGATLVATFWIVTGLSWSLMPLAAFFGALLTAAAIYALTWKRGIAPERMILVGIGMQAALAAGTTYITVRFPVEVVRPAVAWTMGSIYGSTWSDVGVLALFLVLAAPVGIALMWPLRALQLGDDVSRGLGLPLEGVRLSLLVVGCALAAAAVAIAGPIGFVALMVPHVARILGGPASGSTMVLTGFLGATFLLLADTVAQHFLPVSLPVGVITAAVGAPYFLFLLYKSNVRV